MKQGWEVKPLGEICDSINGLWKGKKEPFVQVGVIRNTNFTKDCLLDISDIVYLDVEQKAFSKRSLTKGDIIIERSGGGPKQPVGRAVLFNIETGDFSFSNFTSILRLKNGIKISYYYLHKYLSYFYLSGKTECMQSNVIGIRNLDFDRYKNEVLVPFPSLLEQERIVGILDITFAKIEALRANSEQNLQNAKDLFQASIDKAYAIPTASKPISSVAKVINGYAFSSGDFKPTNDIKSIKITNVGVGEFIEESDNYLPSEYADKLQDAQVNTGDIVIALTRTIISAGLKVAVVPNSYNKALVNQRVAALVPYKGVMCQKYLYNFLLTTKVKNYVLEHVNTLMQPNLSITDLKSIDVPYLPYEEQKVAANNIDALSERCRAMEENYRQTLTACNDLKQALLKKTFNGEL